MGQLRAVAPAALLVGLLAPREALLREAEALLVERHGPVAGRSPVWPFTFTRYYEPEMGPDLLRQFLYFRNGIDPAALPDAKLATQELERRLAEAHALPGAPDRPVNLDPGYVTLAKVVLASTKDHLHRIYLRDGIFAEVTLHFKGEAYQSFPWTYPDYRTEPYHAFFREVRAAVRGLACPEEGPR